MTGSESAGARNRNTESIRPANSTSSSPCAGIGPLTSTYRSGAVDALLR